MNRKFTPEEDAIIRLHYPLGGSKVCLEFITNRQNGAIVNRASTLGIKFIGKIDTSDSPFKFAIDCGVRKKHNKADRWR